MGRKRKNSKTAAICDSKKRRGSGVRKRTHDDCSSIGSASDSDEYYRPAGEKRCRTRGSQISSTGEVNCIFHINIVAQFNFLYPGKLRGGTDIQPKQTVSENAAQEGTVPLVGSRKRPHCDTTDGSIATSDKEGSTRGKRGRGRPSKRKVKILVLIKHYSSIFN